VSCRTIEELKLLAGYLADGDLDVFIEEEDNILDVATLCPYAFGTGVYMNRAWLRAIDMEAKFDELDACGVIEPRSDASFSSSESTDTRYEIFPNPAGLGREITLRSSRPIAGFEIANLWGGIEMRQDLSAQRISETRIQLPRHGLFFFEVWDHDHSSQILKILVVE
jgi:hypothetical protein